MNDHKTCLFRRWSTIPNFVALDRTGRGSKNFGSPRP